DGTLLENFRAAGHPVCGVEPTLMANLANERGVRTIMSFFGPAAAARVVRECGVAQIVTATNVFAHIEGVNEIVDSVVAMMAPDGASADHRGARSGAARRAPAAVPAQGRTVEAGAARAAAQSRGQGGADLRRRRSLAREHVDQLRRPRP